MKPSAQTSFAERLGQVFGRMWRGCLRQERKMNGWLVEHGLPAGGATTLLWITKLVVLGVLLYVAFWMVLVLLFSVVAASVVGGNSSNEDEPEWRIGLSGYGLYRGDTRVDPGSPDEG
ncbi:DUF3742 family protein [Stutzerimonas xanthomarina]|uniref:DUF3742 family protein n=1 Tax=Stutzerimonas xanthomarina TaxID=271420 RepID=UPI00190D9B8F|nr:DUF3742 family protein [Stutzerimonas xanthomarina]MBK3848981.1 DUF3742 family protein [Stutzerimonas xanthomarina]